MRKHLALVSGVISAFIGPTSAHGSIHLLQLHRCSQSRGLLAAQRDRRAAHPGLLAAANSGHPRR